MFKDPRIAIHLSDQKWEHENILPPHLDTLQIGFYTTVRQAVKIALDMSQQFPDATPEAIQSSVVLVLQKNLSRYPNIEVIYDE